MTLINIAFLILAHTDPSHITRLANKLTNSKNFDVFIHVDKKIEIDLFQRELKNNNQVFFIHNRFEIDWGSYNSVKATLELIKVSNETKDYKRFVLLQGLDYPIKSNDQINDFFCENISVEFIRSCKITGSKEKYHSKKIEMFWFFEKKNLLKKIINNLNLYLPFKFRKGYIIENGKKFDLFWGAAQWALSKEAVEYILSFSNNNPKFNRYFKYVFPQDETYFHTILYNSSFKERTLFKKEEEPKKLLENWRNIHYFEYPEDKGIKVLTMEDYRKILKSDSLFIRKVNSDISKDLLDKIDASHRL